MLQRYPAAAWHPLGPQTEPSIGTPRVLIVHTMVGRLEPTDAMFRRNGYDGTEATFGVGGPWDGLELDGVVWQWQELGRQADAQYAGNAYATSVETSDGGDPDRPWSTRQLAALVDLGAWWVRQTGAPAQLVKAAGDRGIGYHSQFREWTGDTGHTCPNPTRIAQLRDLVIPGIAAAVAPRPVVVLGPALLKVGSAGPQVRVVRARLGLAAAGDYDTAVANAVRDWQHRRHLDVDGIVGPKTAASMGFRWAA